MTITALLIFSGALIADSISPGPTVAALIARVLSRGVSGVLPFMLAIWLGEALWLTAAVAGLAALAATFSLLFAIVKWLGVAYLFYLAWTLFTANPETEQGGNSTRSSSTATFLSGLSVALGNPKNMVFYFTLLPSIIDMEDISSVGWLQLVLTLLATLMAVDLTWMLLAAKARQFLRNIRAVRRVNQISGGAMALAATAIAAR